MSAARRPMAPLPITSLYAAVLAVLLLALFLNVSIKRSALGRSIGDGGDTDLHERIRKHGNFVEWTPMVLILMALAEANQASATALHAAGILLLAGRIAHPFGLKADVPTHPLRIAGNSGAMLAVVVLVVLIVRALTGI
jgi:uncharacterized protein